MKKRILSIFAVALVTASMLVGCGGNGETTNGGSTDSDDKLKVSLLVTGSFGDKAFNDSALEGMEKIKAELSDKCEVETVEMGNDKTKFEGSLLDASDSDSDVIIVGTWDMKENLERVAPQYPEKKYIIFDTDVDYSLGLDNVYSMSYKQNEAAFLAGVLASGVTTSDMEFANAEAVIGFIGAKDTAAVINDSAVGYIEGAKFMNPDVKVLVSYVGSYTDSATAKELALTQYSNGADCVFVAAGPASVGVIEAGAESQKYVIGVDSDQALAYEGKDEANYIISSAIKGVGISIYNSIEKDLEGKLPYGTYEQLGLKEGAVGIADNDIYKSVVPEDIRSSVLDAKDKILNGDVTVSTAYGMDEATLKGIINNAQ
ncbi:MAG: BMP family ABC transporter substrate-binding protein [Tyzzerella sp.]|uniref:BMP family ABC transporter substrate-binding protein n=1 Tax=Candidatus Fimicola merdigallinarum TaxID=2840819 RepID=A0A9D9DXH3_9FIRM|nr:BMP family ABC transporter substrate-binding protein [Candidatus Fimicola merdigallinarum]